MFALEEDGGGVRTLCAGRVKSVSGGEGPFPPSPQLLDALLYVLVRKEGVVAMGLVVAPEPWERVRDRNWWANLVFSHSGMPKNFYI